MPNPLPFAETAMLRSGGSGSLGCFAAILVIGLALYFVMRGRQDKPEALGAAKRAMGSGPIAGRIFPCPYDRCPTCSAAAGNMKQQWDGQRKVTWTCGYCGKVAGVQELTDADLPPGQDGPQSL